MFRVILEPIPENRPTLARSVSVQSALSPHASNLNGSAPDMTGRVFGVRNAAAEAASMGLQNRVSLYFKDEQAAMEERIRTYTEQEHSHFAATQLKVNREKEVLLRIMKKVELQENILATRKSDRDLENKDTNTMGLIMDMTRSQAGPVLQSRSSLMNPKQLASVQENKNSPRAIGITSPSGLPKNQTFSQGSLREEPDDADDIFAMDGIGTSESLSDDINNAFDAYRLGHYL